MRAPLTVKREDWEKDPSYWLKINLVSLRVSTATTAAPNSHVYIINVYIYIYIISYVYMYISKQNRLQIWYKPQLDTYATHPTFSASSPPIPSSCTGGAGGVGGITGAATGALDTATVGNDLPWRETWIWWWEMEYLDVSKS